MRRRKRFPDHEDGDSQPVKALQVKQGGFVHTVPTARAG